LSDFNEVPVWVAHITTQFSRVALGLRNELGVPPRPKIAIAPDIGHAKVQNNAQNIRIAWGRCIDFRLVVGRAAAAIDCKPDVAESQKGRRAFPNDRGA